MNTKQTDLRQYSCRVEASCPEAECNGVYTFEISVEAESDYHAQAKAEDTIDRKIKQGKFNFPYSSADLIECVECI